MRRSKNAPPTRWGRQPLADLVFRKPGYRPVAARIPGNPLRHLVNSANGRTSPSPVLRQYLPTVLTELLGRPVTLHDCYTDDILAASSRPNLDTVKRAELEEYVRELVENAPELRPETRDKLAALLRGEAT